MLYVVKDFTKDGKVEFSTDSSFGVEIFFGPYPDDLACEIAGICTQVYNQGGEDKLADIRELLGVPRK